MKSTNSVLLLLTFFLISRILFSQTSEGSTHSGLKTGQPPFPIKTYSELSNPTPAPLQLWENGNQNLIGWGDTDTRYKKEAPADLGNMTDKVELSAWKGERVSAQFVVSAFKDSIELSFEMSDFVNNKNRKVKIGKEAITAGFVRYVMTDELNKDKKGACGHRIATDFDSTLVADPIDHLTQTLIVPKSTTRPGWVQVWIPQDASPGKYSGILKIKDGKKTIRKLEMQVSVGYRVLPTPEDWNFHLDLWQNPYAAARYYQTELWSDAHFKAMEKDVKHYANAGGKSITASIINKPWNSQTHDAFQSMITWTRKMDGSWAFGFNAFDKWVDFMMQMGVEKQINCYSMVPWRLSFEYFDEGSNSMKTIETQPGEEEYEEMWGAMLSSFASHLKEKGWFDKTYISMDERPMETMLETIKVIQKADKNFKISFAGGYHPELFEVIDDYSLAINESFPEEMKEKRRQNGKISSFYTSCSHVFPNSFTFSPPAETAWYGWYAAAENLDGYLRWAYASWVLEPLLDSRFITWAAGDTYFVYPGGRTSIRFEKLMAGIQSFEKIRILRNEFEKADNKPALNKLNQSLKNFELKDFNIVSVSKTLKDANKVINSL